MTFAVTAKLVCAFVLAYAKCWFFHDVAHIFYYKMLYDLQIKSSKVVNGNGVISIFCASFQ